MPFTRHPLFIRRILHEPHLDVVVATAITELPDPYPGPSHPGPPLPPERCGANLGYIGLQAVVTSLHATCPPGTLGRLAQLSLYGEGAAHQNKRLLPLVGIKAGLEEVATRPQAPRVI